MYNINYFIYRKIEIIKFRMEHNLYIYNTLNRKKEEFEPINSPVIGLYVCGPTVYGDSHLGHARPGITYDLVFRYLKYLKYKVRYVRNITDVGHLENDADEGEDKIAKKAKLEQLEPMEVVQQYTNSYHKDMELLNTLKPSIEPRASGHILEQIEMIEKIINNGFAYESKGSVYFDVEKYAKTNDYGKLSGRVLEDLKANTRELDGQSEKKNPFDFALWKKAAPEHIMRWNSKWGEGFPGWHLECSVMSTKYLGDEFDIHGGGLDLQFPHHECEIAQTKAANGKDSVKYWMHNNMVTLESKKMSKSSGNFILLQELFTGNHDKLERAYSPQVVRFFILQAHYRNPLDFSNKALQASEKGMQRLLKAIEVLEDLKKSDSSTVNIKELKEKSFKALDDDLNTPVLISHLFDGVKMINLISDGKEKISSEDLKELKELYNDIVFDILGMKKLETSLEKNDKSAELVDLLLDLRLEAKANKDFSTSDKIRNELTELGYTIRDTKDGFEWEITK